MDRVVYDGWPLREPYPSCLFSSQNARKLQLHPSHISICFVPQRHGSLCVRPRPSVRPSRRKATILTFNHPPFTHRGHTLAQTDARTHTHIDVRTHNNTCTHADKQKHTRTHTHIHTHTYIHTHIHIHTHMHTHMHTHINTYIHTHIHTCIHTNTHINTHINAHTKNRYIHTDGPTDTQVPE